MGKPDAKSPHDIHYYETDAVRRGPWKLVKNKQRVELYNLDEDLGERKNLAKQRPKLVAELQTILKAHAERIAADARPAGFVDKESAKPLISEPGELPKLRDYMGLTETTAVGPAAKKNSAKSPLRTSKNT